jgi:hypothetical protein
MSDHINNEKFAVELGTQNEFFVGNLNKQKTRDDIFQDLTKIQIESLGEPLYISKFNMPKFNARKDQNGNLLLNLGYAFVTTKTPEMARWMIEQKRIKLEDGSDIEIKPISKTKRLTANQNCKNKNYQKFNGDMNNNSKFRKSTHPGTIGEGRRSEINRNSSREKKNLPECLFVHDFNNTSTAYGTSVEQNDRKYFNSNQSYQKNSLFNSLNQTEDNDFNFGHNDNNDFCGNNFRYSNAPASLDYSKGDISLHATSISNQAYSNGHLWKPYNPQLDENEVLNSSSSDENNSGSVFDMFNNEPQDNNLKNSLQQRRTQALNSQNSCSENISSINRGI